MNYVHKLKFKDEAEWLQYKEQHKPEHYVILGVKSEGGEWDDEGKVITEPTTLPGFHVDIMDTKIIQESKPYNVGRPAHPMHGYGWAEPDYHVVLPEDYA